jgi:hypothetical protein
MFYLVITTPSGILMYIQVGLTGRTSQDGYIEVTVHGNIAKWTAGGGVVALPGPANSLKYAWVRPTDIRSPNNTMDPIDPKKLEELIALAKHAREHEDTSILGLYWP